MQLVDTLSSPWAIVPDKLSEITQVYNAHLRGGSSDLSEIEARADTPARHKAGAFVVEDGVAILSIEGVIAKRMNLMTRMSGGVSTEILGQQFRAAVADPEISAIILHLDTPGGAVDGTSALAKTIYESRGRKPIYALADGLMASAGVWIGSAADKIYLASRTTAVGSVGVVTQHVDYSAQEKKRGIKVTDVYAGKYKRITSSHSPLSDEGKDYMQSQVDDLFSLFVQDVAKHRGVSVQTALDRFADGSVFIGQKAIDIGLADGFATLDGLLDIATGTVNDSSPLHQASVEREMDLRAKWDDDPRLRSTFGNDFSVYELSQKYRSRTE